MGDRNTNVKNIKISEIFKNMSYEKYQLDGQLAKKWKESHKPLVLMSFKELVDRKLPVTQKIKLPSEKALLLNKFAILIEKSTELICQICTKVRYEDTRKGIQLLLEYLKFYSTCTAFLPDVSPDVLCIVESYAYPGLLGMVLGPALALGSNVTIATNNQVDLCVLLSELAVEAGYPSEMITVLRVENIITPEFSSWNRWQIVIHFGDGDKWSRIDHNITRLLNITNGKTPAIITDSADQQSCCDILIDAAWECNGQLPWCLDTIFVQENVWDSFISKLKRSLDRFRLGPMNSDSVDVSADTSTEGIGQMILDAKAQGIEFYQGGMDNDKHRPTVFIGQRLYSNNVIHANAKTPPTLTVLPFRTLSEGVALANNNRQGLAASIWGENISQINEAARKLQVGHLWINSFGLFRPDVPLSPWKESGFGHFGGIEGLLEYHMKVSFKKTETVTTCGKTKSIYSRSKASQLSWGNSLVSIRSQRVLQLLDVLQHLKGRDDAQVDIEDWVKTVYESITSPQVNQLAPNYNQEVYDLKYAKEAAGVIAIDGADSLSLKKVIISSLLVGNAVIIAVKENDIISAIMNHFPKDVVNTIDRISDAFGDLSEENIIFIVRDHKVPISSCSRIRHSEDSSMQHSLVRTKIVWTLVGDTYS